jgi:hypothetical protein
MKTLKIVVFALVVFLPLALFGIAGGTTGKTVSGKVTAVNPEAIVVDVGSGKHMLDVGAIVQPDTKLMVKGKDTPVADLTENVKVGDNVTLQYVATNDLYATMINKK